MVRYWKVSITIWWDFSVYSSKLINTGSPPRFIFPTTTDFEIHLCQKFSVCCIPSLSGPLVGSLWEGCNMILSPLKFLCRFWVQ